MDQTGKVAPAPVLFILSAITLMAGTSGCVSLKAEGAVEGYFIKSISIHKDSCTTQDDKAQFGLNTDSLNSLKNKPITAAGVNIQLSPESALNSGLYSLIIRVGKKGKGSASTHKWIDTRITLLGQESVHLSSESSEQVEGETGEAVPDPVSFTLEDITLPVDTLGCVSLKAVGAAKGYFIKSISIDPDSTPTTNTTSYKTNTYYKIKFGLDKSKIDALKKQPITAAGLNIELKFKSGSRHKHFLYTLTMNIGKVGKGSRSTYQTVSGRIIITDQTAAPTHTSAGDGQRN